MPETKTKRKAAAKPTDGQPTVQPQVQPPVAEPRQAKIGRPSKYSKEIAEEICQRLADGEPLRAICRDERMPAWRTVYDWIYQDDRLGSEGTGLSASIARAREIGQDAIAEEIYNEATQEPERILSEGGNRIDPGYVALIKARADIKLKLLAKWNPKRYGDKIELSGDKDNPLHINAQVETKSLFSSILENMELRKQARE